VSNVAPCGACTSSRQPARASVNRDRATHRWKRTVARSRASGCTIRLMALIAAANSRFPAVPARHVVSALIVTYNHADEIAACLDATLAQTGDFELEVVVVDCGSADATLEALEPYRGRVAIEPLGRNAGHAVGVNEAFAVSRGDYALILNPDVEMDPGCVAALLDHLQSSSTSACAAALLRDMDGGVQRFARRDPTTLRDVAWNFTEIGKRLDARRGAPQLRRRVYEDEWSAGVREPLAVDCPAAACVLVPRADLEPRPMDPSLPLFFDDAELWRRLRRAGRTLDVVPAAGAAHGYGTSVSRVDSGRLRAEWVASVRTYLRPEFGVVRRGALWALFVADAASASLLHALGRGDDGTPGHVRGTLGGLGLPGGAQPWLSRAGGLPRRR
jgi:N-acetylglucosaminyl-diphospho-decaprenol L-rhamnosyltransferase